MIYTITFNPSLDYIIQVDDFQVGSINKTKFEKILPGGKGINVSIVLANLGHANCAYGFLAGFTGQEIERRLQQYGCQSQFIHVQDGLSRINVKMKSNEETEINGMGPCIQSEDIETLFSYVDALQEEDILVISGSIPKSLPSNMYEQILQRLQNKNIHTIVDATNELLLKVLPYHPFLIKPNHIELQEMFHVKMESKEEILLYAKKLQDMGAQNVLISMADQGAILLDCHQNIYESLAPQGTVVNSVGAGDSMVAGFIAGYLESNHDYKYAFLKSICTGSASAFSENLATKEEVEYLYSTWME